MHDIDPAAVAYFLRKAISAGRMPTDAIDDSMQTTLNNLELMTKDGKLKNAAVLLFGKRPQRFFISARFRIGRFMADETDLIHHDDIEGNILQMADKVMWKLRQDYLIARIHYEGMQRVEQLEIPETALREIVYNAIVHRDYLGADTQMKVYNDHIWLWNEGELLAGFSVEKAAREHMSKPRNRLIANVFYKAGFIESWGRGVGMVCKAFRDSKLTAPTFENLMGGSLVVIPRGHQTEPLNGNESKVQLNENQQKVYDFIIVMAQCDEPLNEPLNTTRIARELGMAYSTVKRVMKFLEENNLIRRVGSKKTEYWEIVAIVNDSQNDDNPEIRQNPKYSLLFKILFLFFIISTITLLIVVIALATKKEESSDKNSDSGGGNNNNNNNDEEEKENAGYKESWNVLYGIKLENLAYADDIINNTFKYGGINYNEEIGIINGGKDYTKNENNIYTLYIPYESLDKTDKYNGVFLFIHGEGEKKENMEHLCRRYAKMGYITATMDYNEAIPNSNTSNAFRIMDEITYCITHIRKILTEEYEFNGNKLELAIGGFSIGAQFTLLYGYSMRNCSPIPIKFLIDTVGYLDPDPNYWYKVAVDNVSLSDLEPESIDEGIKNGTLIRVFR